MLYNLKFDGLFIKKFKLNKFYELNKKKLNSKYNTVLFKLVYPPSVGFSQMPAYCL